MSTAPLPPVGSQKVPDVLSSAASEAFRAQNLATLQQSSVQQRLREAASAAAAARGQPTGSSSSSPAPLNQAYSKVWNAMTRNMRQVAASNNRVETAESNDADEADEVNECNDDNNLDGDNDNDGDDRAHSKHAKHGSERRGPGERNMFKLKTPTPSKQNQQKKHKHKRRQSESIDALEPGDEQGIDPWASATNDYQTDIAAHRLMRSSVDVDDIHLPVRRLAPARQTERISDANTVLRETDLIQRAHSNEMIWALGLLAALLLVLTLLVAMSNRSTIKEPPPKPAAASQQTSPRQDKEGGPASTQQARPSSP
jgi:hypothetical protein